MYHAGSCPVCGDGLLGMRVCGDHALIVCDECEALWTDPACAGAARFPKGEASLCPICGESLWGPQAHWADDAEVRELNWSRFVKGTSAGGTVDSRACSPTLVERITTLVLVTAAIGMGLGVVVRLWQR